MVVSGFECEAGMSMVDRRLRSVVMVVASAGCVCDGGAKKCCVDGRMRETGEMGK